MIDKGRHSILGVAVNAVDYEFAVDRIVCAAKQKRSCSVSALAVHGVMTGCLDALQARRLNGLDLVLPDGQPVRWALAWLYGKSLPDRIYGPELMLKLVRAFSAQGLSIYFYGSSQETLQKLEANLRKWFPGLKVAGMESSKYRRLTEAERMAVVDRIKTSDADAVLLGLGCPRQEVWAYEYRNLLNIPIVAVGAAFNFIAGTVPQAPKVIQAWALEWLYRLHREPRRLWRRYIILNPLFLWHLALQLLRVKHYPPVMPDGTEPIESHG